MSKRVSSPDWTIDSVFDSDDKSKWQQMSDWAGFEDVRRNERATAIAVVLISIGVGIAVVADPILAVLPLGALATGGLLVSPHARTLFVLFGGMLIFQQGEGVSVSKMAFLGLFGVAFVGAFLNARRLWDMPAYRSAQPLLAASTALVALAALSLAVAHINGIPLFSSWFRDIAPYLLFATAPIFALDAQTAFGRRGLVALLVCAGMLGSLAFAAEWFERRDIADFHASYFGRGRPCPLPT